MLTSLLRIVEAQRPVGRRIRVADTLHLGRPRCSEQRIDATPLRRGVHDEVLRLHPGFLALRLHLLGDLVLLQDATASIGNLELHRLGGGAARLSVTKPSEVGEHEHAVVMGESWVKGSHFLRREVERRRWGGLLDGRRGPHFVHHAVGGREAENVHVPLHAILPLGHAEGFNVGGVHEAGAHGLPRLHIRTMECVEVDADALWLDRLPERGILIHIRPALAGHRPLLAIGARPIRGVGEENSSGVKIHSGIVDGRE